MAGIAVLVFAATRKINPGRLLDVGELVVQRTQIVRPRQHQRTEPGDRLEVLDDDGVKLHQYVALALVVLCPGDGLACGQVQEVLTAIARRKPVSEIVSDRLVQSLDVSAVAALLVNQDAKIRKDTADRNKPYSLNELLGPGADGMKADSQK